VSHSSQTLETVKHHLKPIRQRSVGARQADLGNAHRHGLDELSSDLERFVFLRGGSDCEDLFGVTVEE
jgi:hypothetical protein